MKYLKNGNCSIDRIRNTANNPNKYVVKLRNYNTNNLLFKYSKNIIFNDFGVSSLKKKRVCPSSNIPGY